MTIKIIFEFCKDRCIHILPRIFFPTMVVNMFRLFMSSYIDWSLIVIYTFIYFDLHLLFCNLCCKECKKIFFLKKTLKKNIDIEKHWNPRTLFRPCGSVVRHRRPTDKFRVQIPRGPPGSTSEQNCFSWLLRPWCLLRKTKRPINSYSFIHCVW